MKVILFSDLHAHNWPKYSEQVKYKGASMNSRLADALRALARIRRYAVKHSIKHAIFAGDLFHKKRVIDVTVFNAVVEEMWRFASVLDRLDIITGNHDQVQRSVNKNFSSEHSLYALSKANNVSVIDAPYTCGITGAGMIPYAADRDTILHGIEKVWALGAKYIVLHGGVAGAVTGPNDFQPPEPISLADLPDVPVFAGHYHAPQTLRDGTKKVTYIGAPIEQTRGEKHTRKRGFVVIDTDNPLNVTRVRVPGPQFIEVRASELARHDVTGMFVDLILDADVHFEDCGARHINLVPVKSSPQGHLRLKKVKTNKGGFPVLGDLCEAYVASVDTALDKARLTELGKELLQDAKAGQ